MSNPFYIVGLGLSVDKVMIMPGSQLNLSAPAPSHWARFGSETPPELTVATPEAGIGAEPETLDAAAVNKLNKDTVSAELEKRGVEFDGRSSLADLRALLIENLSA